MSDNDLLPLLQERLHGMFSPLLADVTATMLFTAGGMANWTVEIDRGRASARRGGPNDPTVTVKASLNVLRAVVSGERSGVQAFLDNELSVRGNLTLALQLDGLFPGDRADDSRTYTRVVRTAGIETFYLESGPIDAPAVVLIHGVSATNASMLPLIPKLSAKYHVLAPDLPGHGGTEAKSVAHTPEFLGNWLLAFLRETCDQPAVLIGNSLGGRTALEAAFNSPAEIRGLVLLCPAVAFRKLRQLVPLVRLVRDEFAVIPLRIPRGISSRALRALFADPARLPDAGYEAAVDEFVRLINIRSRRLAVFSALRHLYLDKPFGESGFWGRLSSLAPPALFIWGGRDILVPSGFGKFVSEALPGAKSVIIEDCGHVPQFEHPDLTAQYCLDFIDTLPSLRNESDATNG